MKCEECGYVSWDWRTEQICPVDTKMRKVKDYKCATCGYVDVNIYFMVMTARSWIDAKNKKSLNDSTNNTPLHK